MIFILTMTFCVVLQNGAQQCGTRTFADYKFNSYADCASGANQLNDFLAARSTGVASYSIWSCEPPGEMVGS